MKALTIWQPWASLIMAGAKPWEWRGWPAPQSIVGQRIVIHAGSRAVKPDEIKELLYALATNGEETSLVHDIAQPMLATKHPKAYPLAAGLGTAVLGTPITALAWAKGNATDRFDSDRIDHQKWAWPLTDIELFEPIIPARGAQGFWNWSP